MLACLEVLLFFKSNSEGTLMETRKFQKRWVYLLSTTTMNSEAKGSKVAIRRGDIGTEEASMCLNNGDS